MIKQIKELWKKTTGVARLEKEIALLEKEKRFLKLEVSELSKDITKEKLEDALSICFSQYETANKEMTISRVDVESAFDGSSIPVLYVEGIRERTDRGFKEYLAIRDGNKRLKAGEE